MSGTISAHICSCGIWKFAEPWCRFATYCCVQADVLQKMTDAHLGGFLKLGGYEMIFIATPGRPTDRGQLRLGFVLFPAP